MNVKIVGYCVLVSMVLRNTVSFTTQDSGALLTTIFIRDCWSCVGQGSLSLVGWVVFEYFMILFGILYKVLQVIKKTHS